MKQLSGCQQQKWRELQLEICYLKTSANPLMKKNLGETPSKPTNILKCMLEVMRNLMNGMAAKKPKDNGRKVVSNLVDSHEKWCCRLCRTGHPNDRSSVRAYLKVCEVFLQANVEARIQLVQKHKLCTMSLQTKNHQNASVCPRLAQILAQEKKSQITLCHRLPQCLVLTLITSVLYIFNH